eukprot:9962349-Prorocentrum_lima.AAC.1
MELRSRDLLCVHAPHSGIVETVRRRAEHKISVSACSVVAWAASSQRTAAGDSSSVDSVERWDC